MSNPAADRAAMRRHRAQVRAYRTGKGRVPDEWRKHHANALAPLERRWRKTGNPLWVWRALCVALPTPDEHLHPAFPRHVLARHPLPDWISDYLWHVAQDVAALGLGQDFRTRPPGDPPYPPHRGRDLKKQAPTDLVATALGFTGSRRDGTSAFRKDKDAWRVEDNRDRFARLLANGATPAAAREVMLVELGRTDDSQLKKDLRGVSPGAKRRPGPRKEG